MHNVKINKLSFEVDSENFKFAKQKYQFHSFTDLLLFLQSHHKEMWLGNFD